MTAPTREHRALAADAVAPAWRTHVDGRIAAYVESRHAFRKACEMLGVKPW